MDNTLPYSLTDLPKDIQQEVKDFIEFLLSRRKSQPSKSKKPTFGSAKGKIKLTPDFDEPLEDFKDYQ
jgi:hypothetical protein